MACLLYNILWPHRLKWQPNKHKESPVVYKFLPFGFKKLPGLLNRTMICFERPPSTVLAGETFKSLSSSMELEEYRVFQPSSLSRWMCDNPREFFLESLVIDLRAQKVCLDIIHYEEQLLWHIGLTVLAPVCSMCFSFLGLWQFLGCCVVPSLFFQTSVDPTRLSTFDFY